MRPAPRKELKTPSLPRTPSRLRRAPPGFLPIGTRVLTCAIALDSRGYAAADGWGALVLSIGKARSIVVTEPIQLRSDFTRLLDLPPNILTNSYYFRHYNKHAQTKPNSLGHRFSGTAFGWSSFLTAKSSAPFGSSCQSRLCSSARRMPQNRAVLASEIGRASCRERV